MDWIIADGVEPLEFQGFVYLLTNIISGRMYVGRKYLYDSKGKETNWKNYYGSSRELSADVKALGVQNFRREVLHWCQTKAECNFLEVEEQFSRKVLHAMLPDGSRAFYNKSIMGKYFVTPEHLSDETRAKMSATKTGTKHSEETRAKMSATKTGTKHSEETRAKMSATAKNMSDETRAKISAASAAQTGKSKPHAGVPRSAETRAKISATKLANKALK